MKRKFWNWIRDENEDTRILYLNGEISDETWYGDEMTPELFRSELQAGSGDITVWINSPGGDVFAAAQIYNMLMDYKGSVTVKVDALAASAASGNCDGRINRADVSGSNEDDPQSNDNCYW